MARYSLSGAVDFAYLEQFAAGDTDVVEEVLGLFREQAAMWGPMLDPSQPGWRDAAHTVKGMARGVGAFALGDACEAAEAGSGSLGAVRLELERALSDVAAYQHEQALRSLKGS
jgi:HPt (histidine-containing phosphotransfer) domain-containing protein